MTSRRPASVHLRLLAFAVLVLGVLVQSCSSEGFGKPRASRRLEVTILQPAGVTAPVTGTKEQPLGLLIDKPMVFKVVIRAVKTDGTVDTDFTRFVRMSSKPGAIQPLTGPDVDGRNILLKNGVSGETEIRLANAFGVTYIIADDLGYVPSDPLRAPPPQCSNGIDDNGNGTVDFPADPGCAFANDDAEESGTFAQGASQPIFISLPRIAEARGRKCEPSRGCSGNGATPYPKEQILLDTGYRESASGVSSYAFSTVVTRISSDGFYVADIGDQKDGFNSIFAFNFNAPPRMRVCDRLKTYGGTANEFFGFTQISYPTWTLEEWDPKQRLCLVPEPARVTPTVIQDRTTLLQLSGSLVRVETTTAADGKKNAIAKVTPKFGPGNTPCRKDGQVQSLPDPSKCDKDPVSSQFLFVPGPDASNCDFDGNGRIDFSAGNPENDCSAICTLDPECTEYSNYKSRSTFRITVTNSNGSQAIQADATASAGFDPYALKGVELRSFSGTLHFFSGGSQFTIEARCKDDILLDLKSAPLRGDVPCDTNPPTPESVCPAGFQCFPLGDGTKGCRAKPPESNELIAPPLSCIFPRTFVDNNPQ
ncbi:MAG: hypothetical protein JST00_11415 [Deltaproteobacteria bacterium]|nr:hypothetical protein [Deltaproteobacteria bacterium]